MLWSSNSHFTLGMASVLPPLLAAPPSPSFVRRVSLRILPGFPLYVLQPHDLDEGDFVDME